ncbi:MAG TPA: helix-turn-helix transcriptional regulator [Candidatus Saccharimonadales bacterium]|nr:helix-turn-helix transcriptional regulator [Candidatus Saccharimonadales bacterium]
MATASDLILVRHAARDGSGRRLRETAGIGLREGASLVGVDPGTLSRWETGMARPRGAKAALYARFLRELTLATGGLE